MSGKRTSGLLLSWRVKIFAFVLREGLGDLDGCQLRGLEGAQALLLARRRFDPCLPRLLLAVDLGDAVVSRLGAAAPQAQVAPELVLELSVARRLCHGRRVASTISETIKKSHMQI